MDFMKIVWSVIWLILLIFIGWPVAGFCVKFYILLLPFSACIHPIEEITDLLFKGVRLPYEFAIRLKDGKNGW